MDLQNFKLKKNTILFDGRNYAVQKFAVSPSCYNSTKHFPKKCKEQGPKEALIKGTEIFIVEFFIFSENELHSNFKFVQSVHFGAMYSSTKSTESTISNICK